MTERIVIVGARPSPTPFLADRAIFVNGAISASSRFVETKERLHVVASTVALSWQQRSENSVDRGRIESYRGAQSDELIVVGRRNCAEIAALLERVGYATGTCRHLSSLDQEALVRRIAGFAYPIAIDKTFSLGVLPGVRILWRSLRKYVRYALLAGERNPFTRWHRAYTASNGVFALLYAISRWGPDNEFFLTGISLEPRAYRYAFGDGLPRTGVRDHYLADREILRSLARRSGSFRIVIDDEGLSEATGIPVDFVAGKRAAENRGA